MAVHSSYYNYTWLDEILDFCYAIKTIDQPDPDRPRVCPPEKGWALMVFEAWTPPLFMPPVRLIAEIKLASH
jgi:hypothetical protein